MKKQTVLRRVDQLGASVDWENSWVARDSKHVIVDAPEGFRFCANGHWSVVVGADDEPVSEVWQELHELLALGVQEETPEEASDRVYEQG